MKLYRIQGDEATSRLEVIKEEPSSVAVRIVRSWGDYEKVSEEKMSRELFDTCIRTGYLAEVSA